MTHTQLKGPQTDRAFTEENAPAPEELETCSGAKGKMTLPHTETQTALRKRPGRTEFQRGILSQNSNGQLEVGITGGQGSGILSSMSEANCFIVLPAECDGVAAGQTVVVEPFAGLV